MFLSKTRIRLPESCATARAYDAIFAALDDVKKTGNLPISPKIRNAPTKFMKVLEYGKGYEKYDEASYLPEKLKNRKYLK
ncbi:MAG: hypothetical protein AAB947_00665 [Patescibacteria group bacterium]